MRGIQAAVTAMGDCPSCKQAIAIFFSWVNIILNTVLRNDKTKLQCNLQNKSICEVGVPDWGVLLLSILPAAMRSVTADIQETFSEGKKKTTTAFQNTGYILFSSFSVLFLAFLFFLCCLSMET